MRHHESIRHTTNVVYSILLIGFIYTIHLVLPLYVDSSYLSTFTSEQIVGMLFTFGSIVTVIAAFFIERILERFGNYKTSIVLTLLSMALLYGLLAGGNIWIVGACFILVTATISLLGLNLDIFLETYTETGHTGGIRGLYMSVCNIGWVMAPLLGAMLIGASNNYRNVYIGALSLLFILLYLIHKNLRNFKDPHYSHIAFTKTLSRVLEHRDLSKLFAANIILNTFYAWMTIYIPIYLHTTIGFGWDQIGMILTIMLLPFIIFQFPAGRRADQGLGEKKMMSIGFLILGVSTISLAFLHGDSFAAWALALFVTRIGAAVAEVMIEAYFFKKVTAENADLLSSFRITRYIAYIIAPAITAIGLFYTTRANIFIILGLIVLWALRYSMTITDVV